jgi:Mg2+-importing ATPase
MVTKGAVEPILSVCSTVRLPDGSALPLDSMVTDLRTRFMALSHEGLRVLGVACRDDLAGCRELGAGDEKGMTFLGFLCFSDPPREAVGNTLRELAAAGIAMKLVTGDNRYAARHVAEMVGMDVSHILTGEDLRTMAAADLAVELTTTSVFAEIEPSQKEFLVRAFQHAGNSVGFLGDGINDAPALHAADVGISVDTAVNVAKDAASIVLLRKDLAVLADGVRLGRRTFSNTRKYVFITTSASFGNVASMAMATLFLPFLPLLPFQILLLNVLTDLPAMTIAADDVDAEELQRPGIWDIALIRRFMLVFGLLSSGFDLISFGVLRVVFDAGPTMFRTGWFLESVGTELAVMLVLRTRRPFFRSHPGRSLIISSALLALITLALLYSPLASGLGFDSLPPGLLLAIAVILACYVAATEITKRWFFRNDHVRQSGIITGPVRGVASGR